ncbi:MAG: hypothetical protein AB1458_12065 [Bacteroidota bacterium]
MFPYFKRFDLAVTSANETYNEEFELDKEVRCITGILLTSDRDDQLYYRGAQKIEFNGKEYFPDNYESKLLMSGINVRPNQRFYEVGRIEVLNGKIKVSYTDSDNPNAVFAAYRVSFYVRGEKESET